MWCKGGQHAIPLLQHTPETDGARKQFCLTGFQTKACRLSNACSGYGFTGAAHLLAGGRSCSLLQARRGPAPQQASNWPVRIRMGGRGALSCPCPSQNCERSSPTIAYARSLHPPQPVLAPFTHPSLRLRPSPATVYARSLHPSLRPRPSLTTVCACTPCTASTSSSAPWHASSERDTS